LTAALVRLIGDFDLAEEVVQDSLVSALETWPLQGIPGKPGAWLMTAARRRAIDILRRDKRYRDKVALLERSMRPADPVEADDRLRLIFTCCHPALSAEAQIALTLRAVAGFTTAEIAAAFLVGEPTMAQRIVRAKRKIVAANIPYRVPEGEELPARLDSVLAVLYLMFNEGYLSRGAELAARRDLAEDAAWLTGLVAVLMPDQPEVLGLLAMMKLNLARAAARFDAAGEIILMPDQDRTLWDRARIEEAIQTLDRAGAMAAPGPYQLQAAIAATHAEAESWDRTDWHQIVVLYDALLTMSDSPVVRLNRAVALSYFAGPQVALGELNDLALALSDYHLFHSSRAELLDSIGERGLAREARQRALDLSQNPAERSFLERKLREKG
jgi:RNA polymerase sigma-70 factor (ECF subfamily)